MVKMKTATTMGMKNERILDIKYPVDERYIETAYMLKENNGGSVFLYEKQEDYDWISVGGKRFTVPKNWLERPRKSAFQEWENSEEWHYHGSLLHQDEDYEHLRDLAVRSRKEGWNAAIDKVIEICISIPGFPGGERFEKIDSLKEP